MAHFAEIDENNIVLQVMVINNTDILVDGVENETRGIEFCKTLWPNSNQWIQTSYNRSFRKNYAGIGYTYDETRDAFIPPKPYPSWVLNEPDCWWEPPTPSNYNGTDGKTYAWDEDTTQWVEVTPVVILG